jgi:hypothetical protein
MNASALTAFAFGAGAGIGIAVTVWCLTSLRDFVLGYLEGRRERLEGKDSSEDDEPKP